MDAIERNGKTEKEDKEQKLLDAGKAIRCPDCGAIVTKVLEKCRHCGCNSENLCKKANDEHLVYSFPFGILMGKETKEQTLRNASLLEQGKALKCPNCNTLLTSVASACPSCACPKDTLRTLAFNSKLKITSSGEIIGWMTEEQLKEIKEEQEIQRQQEEKITTKPTVIMINDEYSVNPNAERVANGVAGFILAFSIIVGVFCLIFGIGTAIEYDELPEGIPFIGAGLIIILIGIIAWASIKLFVNISRNLYNINDSIKRLYTYVMQQKS